MAARTTNVLRHFRLANVVDYVTAAGFQELIVNEFLHHKKDSSFSDPGPHIITAEFHPVYTCGRREIGTISKEQQDYLQAPGPYGQKEFVRAQFVEAKRGGQITFHGPGQLVAYPIIDLKAHKLTPRCYVDMLENSLIVTCARYGIKAFKTENTGVWTSEDDKIAAVGVHMRRNITSHGIGLNVNTDLWWFDRIVACGLEGKRTTSFEKQGVTGVSANGMNTKDANAVSHVFVEEFAKHLGVKEIIHQETKELNESDEADEKRSILQV